MVNEKSNQSIVDLPLASSTWDKEELDAILSVIETGKFSMGDCVRKFEEEFANYFGSRFSLMFNSGSSANLAMIAGLRYRNPQILPLGSEIIVPAVSWSTTYYPVHQLGYKLRFVDVNISTLNMDVEKVNAAINKNTGAIFAVNLLGNPADLDALRALASLNNLTLIEDNCESMGAKLNQEYAGTFGLAGSFSTFFSHHISTMEGGFVVTDDESLFETMKSLRAHGWTRDLNPINSVYPKSGSDWEDLFRFVLPGYNLRPIEIEAAIGRVQLRKLSSFVKIRRQNAKRFMENMGKIPGFLVQEQNGESSSFGFSLICTDSMLGKRDKIINLLTLAGVQTRPIVAGNFTRNPVIKHLNHATLDIYPNADLVHDEGLFFGNHHFDLSDKIDKICAILEEAVRTESRDA